MNATAGQQFNALTSHIASFNADAKMADHLRRREVDQMNRAAEQHRREEEELRIIHGSIGEETRRHENLKIEGKRYKDATENDRQESVTITSEIKGKETNDKEQKIQWVKDMEDVNNENDYSLSRRENKNQSTLLDAENVEWIVESKLDVVLNNNAMVMDNNDGFVDGNHNHTAEEWNEIATLVKDEGVGMVKTQEKKEAEAKEMNAMEAFIHQLRNKLMASQQGQLGEMEIGDLESTWDKQMYSNDSGEEDVVVDENSMDAVNIVVEGSGATTKAATATVHMDLFYNGQEYGSVHDETSANKVGYAC